MHIFTKYEIAAVFIFGCITGALVIIGMHYITNHT